MRTYIPIAYYKGVQLKSKLQRTGIWSAAARPPILLCYRPAVFLHLSHSALIPVRKNSLHLVRVAIQFFYSSKIVFEIAWLKIT